MRIHFQNCNYLRMNTVPAHDDSATEADQAFDLDDGSHELPTPKLEVHTPSFTGSGKEYFRIWVVNLFLTCATLGIYSAWAKVRRLQYFDRNTQLAGAVFDFSGDPKAILRGRVLALVFLAAYNYAFGFSLMVGAIVFTGLLVTLPLMMRGALRFRLHNTRYRGLRFGFHGTPASAYHSYLPFMVMIMLPSVLLAFQVHKAWLVLAGLLYLMWPPAHGLIKEYQHRHIAYGNSSASYDLVSTRFYYPYFISALIMVCMVVLVLVSSFVISGLVKFLSGTSGVKSAEAISIFALVSLVIYLTYLLTLGYLHVRLTNLVWSNTHFPGVKIRSELRLWPFYKIQIVNTVLTVLTVGLYRPFAVVRMIQYRLSCMSLETDGSFDSIISEAASKGSAGADGVADFFGVDLSW